MHVSLGCVLDERINSAPYHELLFAPRKESKSTSQEINQALFRCIETDTMTKVFYFLFFNPSTAVLEK